MIKYAFEPSATVTLPIKGSDAVFPVRRVYCIGRNYASHAIEMGHDPNKEPPFFFQKNPNNLNCSGIFPYPTHTSDVHHEIELAVMLHAGGTNIPVDTALDHVFGYAPSLDMTRRDLQGEMKKMGRPWEIGKAFERSAPIGKIQMASDVGHLSDGAITLCVNNEVRQTGNLNQMIWKVSEMISYLSDYFELAAGDVILSGTPAGVGPIQKGDTMELSITGLDQFNVQVV